MADDKKKRIKITSAKGRLGFPKLIEPDYGNKEYPKPDGEFSTKLVLELEDAATQAMIAKLQPLYDAAIAEAEELFKKLKPETRKKLGAVKANPLFTELLDKETEEPTGEIEFKFSRKASGTFKKGPKEGKKWTATVPLFDAKLRPIKAKGLQIWGGTVAKISFEPSAYFIPGTGAAGLKLNLESAQIIELSSGGARSARDYGFGEEDGYEHEDREDADEGAEGSEDQGDTEGQTPDF